MPSNRLTVRVVPMLLVVTFVAAACGADSSSGSSSGSSSRPATSTPSSSSPPANPCGVRASTVPRGSQNGPGLSLLQTAEVSAAQCTDDVRFTFASSDVNLPPRYVAEYQDGPFIDVNQPTQANPEGNAFLVIRFEKAQAAYAGRPTFRSRESITPSGMHHLKEVRQVASPENTVLFVIGLDDRRPFMVDSAPSPPHVVVRIA